MAERRLNEDVPSSFKRQKLSPTEVEEESNPYLAHWNEPQQNGQRNGYGNGASQAVAPLAKFGRHKTTAALASKAEDGPNNPFNSKPLSNQYFNILKVRRKLPVHVQRYAVEF